ncbi:hypothetical protein FC56_GL001108 [Lentilactobacillus senioris DSM 24302 = JCM 17472]|uniref:Uncharacterized protein n=1 Tax=Lentilactobacillus senioris DSM 24302 = JCM 17472 TaxID=1423802 RepID=A0A0R2CQQ3_9LACO|nr:hypothetical protein [Lentilactobacillus senioris]KRM94161.1 hypothetical protein FC56_GL001108 [Lentilactobacillus senioris DSM 24302 = JCM 17472]
MTINLKTAELQSIKERLAQRNLESHFVIVLLRSKETQEKMHIITDYESYRIMADQNYQLFDFQIVRDIVPITTNLAYWAYASDSLAEHPEDENQSILVDLDKYTELVLAENRLEN